MRSPEEVFEDIENDRAHRQREIRLIENIASRTESESEANMLRRSLVLLTYSHFEGFCKFALLSSTRSVCPAVMRQRLWWRLAVRGGMSLVTLAIGPGLFPVAAQCRLAPAPRRGLGAIIENPLTFLRRAHLQSIERAVHRAVVKLSDDGRKARRRAALRGHELHPRFAEPRDTQRERFHRLIQRIDHALLAWPLGRIAPEIVADRLAQAQRVLELLLRGRRATLAEPPLSHPRTKC